MKLIIYKAMEVKPPLGEDVFVWDVNKQTKELDWLGIDRAIEMEVWETDENGIRDTAYEKEVENELTEGGFLLNIGWKNTGENVHQGDYWSYTHAV